MTYTEQLERRALEALVTDMMMGRNYPRHGTNTICLATILDECDQHVLASAVLDQMSDDPRRSLSSLVEDIVSDYLENTHWHEDMQQTMREDDEATARESAMESKAEIRRAEGQSSTACDDQFLGEPK